MVGAGTRRLESRRGQVLVESSRDDSRVREACDASQCQLSGNRVRVEVDARCHEYPKQRTALSAIRHGLSRCVRVPGPVSCLEVLSEEDRVGVAVAGADEVQGHLVDILFESNGTGDQARGHPVVGRPEDARGVCHSLAVGPPVIKTVGFGRLQVCVLEGRQTHVATVANVTQSTALTEVVVVDHTAQ